MPLQNDILIVFREMDKNRNGLISQVNHHPYHHHHHPYHNRHPHPHHHHPYPHHQSEFVAAVLTEESFNQMNF